MTIGVRNLEWLNHNATRAYPLAAGGGHTDTTGSFTIPLNLLVGLYLPIHWGYNISPFNFFIRRIVSEATGCKIVVGYSGVDGDSDVATVTISRVSHTENATYVLGGVGTFVDSRGHVVIGSFDNLNSLPYGSFTFDIENTRLEPDCFRPNIRAITALQLENGNERSELLSGVIRLKAGRNVQLRTQVTVGQDPVVIIDAIDGTGLNEQCECEDDSPPIKFINNVGPDPTGKITLLGNVCLTIEEQAHTLVLKDICSEPCCGCKELEAITEALQQLGNKATTVNNFLTRLEASVTQMDQVVLGSQLGDVGCVP